MRLTREVRPAYFGMFLGYVGPAEVHLRLSAAGYPVGDSERWPSRRSSGCASSPASSPSERPASGCWPVVGPGRRGGPVARDAT